MNFFIDLNADLGEGGDNDALILPLVSSANIACGAHAGDVDTMRRTMDAALAAGVAIGAHPGYEDRAGFGRRPILLDHGVLRGSIMRQLDAFLQTARECGASPRHVKPHGALYNQADRDSALARLFVECVKSHLPGCRLYCPPAGALAASAREAGLAVVAEGFADRRYQRDGSLVPRDQPAAVITDPEEAASQAEGIALHSTVVTCGGETIALPVQTLCAHGDSPDALRILRAIRRRLLDAGLAIKCP